MKVLVLLNQAAGTLAASKSADEPERIRAGFVAAGIDADVRTVAGNEIADAVADAVNHKVDAVIGGGGDGTLNTIANALAGTSTAFGVLPLGTHNHFAKELNVPLDLDAAVIALSRGKFVDLDIGEVNGRVFLNFSALGLHPLVVKHRDAQRNILGRKKFIAMGIAVVRVLRILPLMRVILTFGDTTLRRITPSVIVCNNAHQMEVFGVRTESSANRDTLNVYLAKSTSRAGLIWLGFRAAIGRINTARKFEALSLPELAIDTRNHHARVSIDGEIVDLRTPLHYRVRKAGLKVIVSTTAESGPK